MPAKLTHSLRSGQSALAEKIVDRQPHRHLQLPFTASEETLREISEHLTYLAEAVDAGDPLLYSEYVAWIKATYAGRNFPDRLLPSLLASIREVLVAELPVEEVALTLSILDGGIEKLASVPSDLHTFLDGDAPLDRLARRFLDALLAADRRAASQMILDAVQNGVTIPDIYMQVFQRTQREIGRLWQINQISVAHEHFCTAATQLIMSQLYPYIFTGERKTQRIVVACVGGELHEIGARMVADFFEMKGWDTYFLGANTPPESILHMVEERRAEVLALSVTMTFHVSKLTKIIQDLRSARSQPVRILVGGYPFNLSPDLWRKIGADGYARDAECAIAEANRILVA
jgi:methylmalonyl-CoA mutase cobalamin-binding domain/chain